MDDEKIKGRTWNGYVCPGCRTVFRVAADFHGSEVMCPSCNGTLRLPRTPEEVQPHTVRPVQLPAAGSVETAKPVKPTKPARAGQLKYDDKEPSPLQKLLASSEGRLRLTLALLLPVALLAGALVIFQPEDLNPVKSADTEAPLFRPESQADEKPAPPPPPVAVNEMPVEEEAPALPEIAVAEPVPEIMPESLPKPVEAEPPAVPQPAPEPVVEVTPPPAPEPPPPVVAKADDLVPALPVVPETTSEQPKQPVAELAPEPEPVPAPAAQPTPEPAATPVELVHTVVRGDTLTSLSRKYQVSIATIKKANGLKSDVIMLDQKLKIPGGTAPAPEPAAPPVAETPAAPVTEPADPPATETPAAPAAPRSHTVVRGDTLERIARKYHVEPRAIMEANHMKNDIVRLGRKLVIPAAP